ncbi:MAG TPA: hypothetical protein VFV38_53130, partial [Ktedonobacteraceae bacterium]|nr:hypothetical protein [Ktedonobacteraceae bacterium]
MITQVQSHQKAAVRYLFDNGNEVSIIFGVLAHADNYQDVKKSIADLLQVDAKKIHSMTDLLHEPDCYESATVEIMVCGNKSFIKWFEEKYRSNPGWYIPVSEILTILQRADDRVAKRRQR